MFYKVTNTVVASTGVYTGKGIARSPRRAYLIACNEAWRNLCIGDRKANYCSGIAAEHTVGFNLKTGEKIYEELDL